VYESAESDVRDSGSADVTPASAGRLCNMAAPIGIVSDTHDNKWAIETIADRFLEEGVQHVIHAGDYVAPFTARCFSEFAGRFVGIFGNNDGERVGLTSAFAKIGKIGVGPHPVKICGRRLLVMHEPAALESIGRSGDFDVVVYGHTHAVDLRTVPHSSGSGQTLIVNPGEACGWLHDRTIAALLDPETLDCQIVEFDPD
jgi:uncharacterized protein